MRKTIITCLMSCFLLACYNNPSGTYGKLSSIDSLLNRGKVDSALFEFKQIDTLLLTKEERAYYDLLKVQAMWKAYIPVSSDTLLDSCLSYYEHAGDVEKLARTCYYKGVLLNDEGHVNEAVEHLKRAERMAGELNDLSFSNKVYTSMSLVNSQAGEHEVALQYAKKTVDSSKKLNSISMLLNDMADLAICYYRVDMKDSAVWWLEQCLPLIENANNNDKSHLLGSLGLMYKKVNLKRGEDLLKQSIAIEPHDFTLNSLANIFQERGDLLQAESLYVQALKISNELQQQINILTAYRDLKSKEGDFESANEMAGQIAALKDSLSRKQKKEAVGMQQVYFDHHVEQEKTASWKWYAKLGIILLLLSLALMYGYYGIRTRRMKRKLLDDQQLLSNRALEIEESAQRIEMLKKKTRLQGDQLRTAERRMEQLKKQQAEAVEQMMNEHKETMMHGNHLFDELENGGSIVRWTNHDIKDFISYYMLKTPLFLTKMEREYARLTPGQQVFLILQDMSFDEEHIKEVLGLTSAAYRTIQSRVNKKILSP